MTQTKCQYKRRGVQEWFHSPARIVRGLAALLILSFPMLALQAGPVGAAPDRYGPFYEPTSGNYFELRFVRRGDITFWDGNKLKAEQLTYKGVQGRLAIVASKEIHEFLKTQFDLTTPAWIGLRYWCPTRSLSWVDGSMLEKTEFSAWARHWNRGGKASCNEHRSAEVKFMPVYYTPLKEGFLWQASGAGKGFVASFIEYPTGER